MTAINSIPFRHLVGRTNRTDHESYFIHFCHLKFSYKMSFVSAGDASKDGNARGLERAGCSVC